MSSTDQSGPNEVPSPDAPWGVDHSEERRNPVVRASRASASDDHDDSEASGSNSATAEPGQEGRSAPRRRRGSRGGRRRRGAKSSASDAEPDQRQAAGGEAHGALASEADPAGDDEDVRRPRRLAPSRPAAAKRGEDEEPPAAKPERTAGRRRSRRRRVAGAGGDDPEGAGTGRLPNGRDAVADPEVEVEEEEPQGAEPADGESRRPRRRRGRRKKAAGESVRSEERPAEARSARASEESEPDDERGEPARRKSRRGRGRGRRQVAGDLGGVHVELIPGEDDDLPELPELPDDVEPEEEDLDSGEAGRRKRSRKKRGSRSVAESDDLAPTRSAEKEVPRTSQILVNAADPEEMRVAVVREGRILDFQMTVKSESSLVSDIYRGRVVNIEPSIGAAFIDFGRGRNGFLHTSDVLPAYGEEGWSLSKLLSTNVAAEDSGSMISDELGESDGDDVADEDANGKDGGKRNGEGGARAGGKAPRARFRQRPRVPITDLLEVGDRVAVQVTKDAIGDKGPTLTTYLSIPGRYLVLMPSITHTGVSRKIDDLKERKRLKRILDSLSIPKGMGVIARTAASGHTKAELKRDVDYLLGAWERFSRELGEGRGTRTLYQESDVAIRTVRDLFGPDTESVIVDDKGAFDSIVEFTQRLMPEHVHRVKMHDGVRPLFHAAGAEQDFERIFSRRIDLPSGGSIVFDQAEALVAIDVNSGKTRTDGFDFEEIALKTNLEAVPEIARQIRLRDLGGILVIDFIDMMKRSNMGQVERAFREALTSDRARSKVGRISQFGLLEMTRQRLGPGMEKKVFMACPRCRGQGRVRTVESRAAAILRRLGSALTLKGFSRVEIKAHPEVVTFLERQRVTLLQEFEKLHNREVKLVPAPDQLEDSVVRYLRTDGREVRPGGRRKR